MNRIRQSIWTQAQQAQPALSKLRRYFHQHPELSCKEEQTALKIEEELDELGIVHRRVGGTGVYAELSGKREGARTIVLRADIDALPLTELRASSYQSCVPGVMHACGHDAHTAALLGAAGLLANNRELYGGTVRFTFQPGEEVGYGARVFVEQGCLDGAQRTFGLHVAPDVEVGSVVLMPGPNNASVDCFTISVQGRSAHVCTPQAGVDALYIASQIVVGMQALVTRRVSPMQNVVVGIGRMEAGTAYNIVAGSAVLEGTVRTMTAELRSQVCRQAEELAVKTAEIYGGTATVEWKDYTSPLVNDETAALEAQKTAGALFGREHVITRRLPALSGDDFAEYILKVPGVYAYVGSRDPEVPETGYAQHDARFDISERCLPIAAALYAVYAIDFLNGTF